MAPSQAPLFYHHPKFVEELGEFIEKHCSGTASVEETIETIQNLLTKHFCDRNIQFTPKHLGPAQGFAAYSIYWLHMIIPNSNLSRTQFPKCYLLKTASHISFLCLDSHITNYKDSQLRVLAQKRLGEVLKVIEKDSSQP